MFDVPESAGLVEEELTRLVEEYKRLTYETREIQRKTNEVGHNLVRELAPGLVGIMTPGEALTIARRRLRLYRKQ